MTALRKLTLTELRLFLREPMSVFFAVLFPSVLVAILGNVKAFRKPDPALGGHRVIDLYVAIAAIFVLAMLALQAAPVVLATYRERGILRRMSTTPVNPVRVVAAQLIANMLIALVAVGLVLAVGRIAFDVSLPRNAVAYAVAFLLTSAAVFALGLFVAAVAPNGKAATAIGSLLFFPLMFFAGLWIPREVMPPVLRTIADLTPLGAGEEALRAATTGDWPGLGPVAVLVGYLVAFGLAAARMFRWQ
ncbi:ABC transporter permease [Luedemannella helvata]|uniref:Transport permease protein n=1 Tax=Luedemannella helvata TaxID=349315 RepID=A0ABP4WSD6_9ACTN